MADLTAKVPTEATKTKWVHDRSRIPARPETSLHGMARHFHGWALGFALALGITALAFQTRATWTVHRDWVVPMSVPLLAAAGLALGHLAARRKWNAAAPGLVLLAVALALTAANTWRGTQVDGSDGWRDALSIIAGVDLGFMVLALLGGLAWVECCDPTKAPPPAA